MKNKNELLDEISKVESKLIQAQRESKSWNKGKYKKSIQATNSIFLVESLKKEISKLYLQLNDLDQ